jgi:hypothetical protein
LIAALEERSFYWHCICFFSSEGEPKGFPKSSRSGIMTRQPKEKKGGKSGSKGGGGQSSGGSGGRQGGGR